MSSRRATLTKVCRGLYMDTKNKMSIEHELVWTKDEGRKWVAEWHSRRLNVDLGKESRKFDTLAEARAFLQGLLTPATPEVP